MEIPENTEKLKAELDKIGFGLRRCGCNHFRIMNTKNRATGFEVFDEMITARDGDTNLFGGYGKGVIGFNLRHCDIKHDAEYNMVSVHPNNTQNVFISFYGDNSN